MNKCCSNTYRLRAYFRSPEEAPEAARPVDVYGSSARDVLERAQRSLNLATLQGYGLARREPGVPGWVCADDEAPEACAVAFGAALDLARSLLPVCLGCLAGIGRAAAGPSVPYRPAVAGEACGAHDHNDHTAEVTP